MRDMDSLLNKLVRENRILIISKPFCFQCDKIKDQLENTDTEYTVVNVLTIDNEYGVDALTFVNELKDTTGGTEYPFCFYGGTYIKMRDLEKKLIKFVFLEDIDEL